MSSSDDDAAGGAPVAAAAAGVVVGVSVVGLSKVRTKRGEVVVGGCRPPSSSSSSSSSLPPAPLPRFADHGECGFYEGTTVDDDGGGADGGPRRRRHGASGCRMHYDSGNRYEGGFRRDAYHGDGCVYGWADGDVQAASWRDGVLHGASVYSSASDGVVEYCRYEDGEPRGAGVGWNSDRTGAYRMVDGRRVDGIVSLEEAEGIARGEFGLPVPEPAAAPAAAAAAAPRPPAPTRKAGFFAGFFSSRKVGPDGRPMFKDHGDWGSYDGEVDGVSGDRTGKGRMTYVNGGHYEGGFVDDKYHGDGGVYRWADGDEYEGGWRGGERHGVGVFRKADGTVEYSAYERGIAAGEGVAWNADRKTATKTLDGHTTTTEMTSEEAEAFARDRFGLPVPEPSQSATTTPPPAAAAEATKTAALTTSSKTGLFASFFSNRKVGPDGKHMFKDHGEWGTYEGDVDEESGNRHGNGKMTYVGGSYYAGGFVNDKYQGDKGLYRWADGDEYEGSWKDGDRQGVGIFRSADGAVIYSTYELGAAIGEGLFWTADRNVVHKTTDGVNKMLILNEEAEEFARDKFGLPVPEPREPVSNGQAAIPVPSSRKTGLIGKLFTRHKVDSDGKPMFKDHGDWGTYDGDVNEIGIRQGNGKMTYVSGSCYEGGFDDDKFHGDKGIYRWSDGDEYEGGWKDGERHGVGIFRKADGTAEYSMYDAGVAIGEGVRWSADRKEAHKTSDGETKVLILCEEAAEFAKDKFELPAPEPYIPPEPSTPAPIQAAAHPSSKTGLFGKLFSKQKVDSDGKPMFKDHGVWGSYDGVIDESGNRQGNGKMTYADGRSYVGGFDNNKFHGDKGVYHWADGDVYEGSFRDGERHGVGIFRLADGAVEYSTYDAGVVTGGGLAWSADRKTAHKTADGKKINGISPGLAEKLAKEIFDLPVPAPSATVSTPAKATGKPRLLKRLFSSKTVGPDGKPMFKDNGDWGSYEGDVDQSGNRQGNGKMTYVSGSIYEGGFVDDKFHGDKGSYRWSDGDEYEGGWKDGERQGVGVFRSADGTVEYSIYEMGATKGGGLVWSADRKTAHKTVDGEKTTEMLVEEAVEFAKEIFDLPVPEPYTKVSAKAAAHHPTAIKTGLFGKLFSRQKIDSDGKPMFKDHGTWGSYEGDVDNGGNRQGKGKMTYVNGCYYEGGFVDDKFHGDKGVYHWFDGDEYEGGWKDGERHGVGIFRSADGTAEYSTYDAGVVTGEGLVWSADRKSASKTVGFKKGSEISISMAEKLAKDIFDLPAPARSALKGELRFEDHGDVGTYQGDLVNGIRQGEGKMSYDSGNSYEGDFSKGKFDGNRGSFRWADGTHYEGSWKDGLFNGVGIFRIPDIGVDYSMYKDGYATGVGVFWNLDYTKAFHTLDGVRMTETSLADAQKLAKAKFGLPTPKQGVVPSLGEKRHHKKVGADGKPMFKDHGVWGSYKGELDISGERVGNGKMTYVNGNNYEGSFVDDEFHGDKGVYHWFDGDEYEGGWKDGERHGVGIFRSADGTVEYSIYDMGSTIGEGVVWSADRKAANKTLDGKKKDEISLGMAEKLAREFDLPVPEPSTTESAEVAAVPTSSKTGLFSRLFPTRKVGPDGKLMFKDHGEWGTYIGDVDESGSRQGEGKMTYVGGGYYEGGLVDDKFHGDKGVYHWADGSEYEGSWKDGERHGVGIFRSADDGIVEISMYDAGEAKGEGVVWSADRKTAHKTMDSIIGKKRAEMLVEEAAKFTMDKFGLSVPEPSTTVSTKATDQPDSKPSTPVPTQAAAQPAPRKTGFFASFFSSRKVGPDSKPMFKDHGEWGTYEGDVEEESGNRRGKGKMTYVDGNSYEGGFVDDKYHDDRGVYRWADGDEYEGPFRNGERHGAGIFRSPDGAVAYSMYDAGAAKGEGVAWSADRKAAHKTADGKKTTDISIEEATDFSNDKFKLPAPEPSSTAASADGKKTTDMTIEEAAEFPKEEVNLPNQITIESKSLILPVEPSSTAASAVLSLRNVGFIASLFSTRKVNPDGKPMFKDNGDWGSYEGDVDESGNRQGNGKMTYVNGDIYEGGFVDNKFHCDRGLYRWADGEEHEGGWMDGDRQGIGIYRTADGTENYSMYEKGEAKGDGVEWSADRKTTSKCVDGIKTTDVPIKDAELLVKEKFVLSSATASSRNFGAGPTNRSGTGQ